MSESGVWNFRGALARSWQERKEETRMTVEALLILGIETAEKEKEVDSIVESEK